jgi:hypothetical protein
MFGNTESMMILKKILSDKNNFYRTTIFLAFIFCYFSIAFTFTVLDFNVLQSDAKGYWDDSLSLNAPFHPFHVPGYPVVICILRIVTLSLFSPAFYLQSITFLSFCMALFLIFEIGMIFSGSKTIGLVSALLFMLWPMVGLTYVIYPVADSIAMALFLLGLFLFLKEKPLLGSIAWAGTLFMHKATWVFVAISFFVWFFRSRQAFVKKLAYGAMVFIPLLVYSILGSFYHGSFTWIASSNFQAEMSSNGDLLLFNGLLGTLRINGIQALGKGSILLAVFFVSIFTIFYSLINKYRYWEYGFAIGISTLVLTSLINQYEIWAIVRFGRLLVVPLSGILGSIKYSRIARDGLLGKSLIAGLVLLLFLSQFFYAWYMTVYFGGGK